MTSFFEDIALTKSNVDIIDGAQNLSSGGISLFACGNFFFIFLSILSN